MMLKNILVILAFAWFALIQTQPSPAWSAPTAAHPARQAYVTPCAPGVVYIQFKIGSTVPKGITSKGEIIQSIGAGAFQKAMSKLGLREIIPFDAHASKDSIDRALGIDRMYCLYYSYRTIDPHDALAMLMMTGEIECGSVRYLFPETSQPNDPYLSYQYALTKMNVFNAWATTTGDTSIVIADVDCAINIDHEDLKNEIKYNWGEVGTDAQSHDKRSNGIDDDGDGYVDNWEGWDVCGDVNVSGGDILSPNNDPRPREGGASHGTHTAGCILATGNNGVGIAGVAYGCRLLPIKVAGADYDNIGAGYEGIHYASTHGARIINCSWGGPIQGFDTAFANVFLFEAKAYGSLVIAASGNGTNNDGVAANNDINPEYPASGPSVLSVGATDQNDQPASYSNYGHTVSVWAPGSSIWSCDYPGNSAYSPEDGTSFAAPNAAGVAALLWSQHKDWLPEFISRQLITTCDNVVNPGNRTNYWGRLNAGSALISPLGPGLIITSYSLDGVASDSLRPGQKRLFAVTFKNVMGAGTNLSATAISSLGAQLSGAVVTLGSMSESATATGNLQITRTGVFSEGNLPISFAVKDGSSYVDTISILLPLSRTPGFVMQRAAIQASSIKRVSNTVAWAAFGNLNSTTGAITGAQYAHEQAGQWSDTATLSDGTVAPFDVEALDSLTAYFGTGQSSAGSVIYTTDGGQHFSTVSVATFTPFVNSIHFFDSQNGILIGDPKSSRWGICTTSDGGQSWHALAKPIVVGGSTASWNNATAWVGDNGWFGTNSREIMRTTDRGQTWKLVKTGYQHSLGIGFDDDATHGFACFRPAASSGSSSTTGTNGIMVTADGGATWDTLATLPMAGISPSSIKFIPNSHIAILTSNVGVYRTSDLGATWSPIGIPVSYTPDGSQESISRDLGEFVVSINSVNNGIATYSDTITSSEVDGVRKTPVSQLSFEVNPNPAEGMTMFSFVLSSSDRTSIAIYDAVGRRISDVADRMFGQGPNYVAFDTHALSPGAYYAVIETASGTHLTRAITILR